MSSYRKPEIQNDLPKINKVKLICYFFHQNIYQKILNYVNVIIFNHYFKCI